MLIVYNPMNIMTQHWKNGDLLPKQMSRLIFHRYSAFSSSLSGVESGKICAPQRANQWADILELLNSVAFPSSTPTWLQRKKRSFLPLWSTKPGSVLPFFFPLQLPSVSSVSCLYEFQSILLLFDVRHRSKHLWCCCTYYTKNRGTQKSATEI